MTAAKSDFSGGGRLNVPAILRNLVQDGIITQKDAKRVVERPVSNDAENLHPLELIAQVRINRASPPHEALSMESLLQWLAKRTGLTYLRIDPLKVDVAAVTNLVTYAYSSRYKILPVEVTADKVIIATADPFDREWEEELSRI